MVALKAEQDIPFVRVNVRHKASLALSFAAAKAKKQYNIKYRPLLFDIKDNAYLRLHQGYYLPNNPPRKYSQQRAKPFKVLKKIKLQAYRLNFPPNWRIHPIVSIQYLDKRPGADNNPFQRQPTPPGPVKVNNDKWEVETILAKRIDRRGRGHPRPQ